MTPANPLRSADVWASAASSSMPYSDSTGPTVEKNVTFPGDDCAERVHPSFS